MVLVRKPKKKRELDRPKHRREDIKINLKEIER
jgi:hypothetical protein